MGPNEDQSEVERLRAALAAAEAARTDVDDLQRLSTELAEANAALLIQRETIRFQAEALLEERTAERDRFFTLALDMMITCATDGTIRRANPAFLQTLGYAEAAIVGTSLLDLVHPDDRGRTIAEMADVAEGRRSFAFENRYRHADGSYRLLDWKAVVESGQIYGTARDVTEARRAAEALRESETRYRSLFEAISDTIILVGPSRGIEAINPGFTRMFGYTLEDVRGRTSDFLYASPGDWAAIGAVIGPGMGPDTRPVETLYQRKNGEVFPAAITIFTLDDEAGGVRHFVGVIKDLTEARRAEAQIRDQLDALKRADEMKDQFLGILSHELRTPLNAILGFGSILEDGLAGELTEDQARYVAKILASSDQMLGLVEDLLDMSRVQAGKFTLSPEPLAIAWMLRETVAHMAAAAAASGHALVDATPEDLPWVDADARRITQVVNNLVGNALKFTPRGGTVTVSAAHEGDMVRVTVADTGIGIPAHEHARIFQSFTQVDMTHTRQKGGVGLGLSICKALVEAHGGAIGVESAPKRGSTFWFTLPLSEGA